MRPWAFEAAGCQKTLKIGRFLCFLVILSWFLASSSFKTAWLHPKHRKSYSERFFRSVDPHEHPEGVSIAE